MRSIDMKKVLVLLLTLEIVYASHKIPWWNIKAAQEQGPNVCVVEEVPELNRKYYTECKYWQPRLICGKRAVVRYECCEGYQMIPGQLGCTGVKPLADVVETARSVGAAKFAKLLEKSGVAEELKRGPAVTVFAPTDESFDHYLKAHDIQMEWLNDGGRYRNLVLNHIANKRLLSTQWKADLLVDSKLTDHKLRINKYSNGVETVNCEEIIRKNQHATNGIVHVIDGVLDPASSQNLDIIKAIAEDGRYFVLAEALERSDLIKRIRDSEIPHTIFAPSDEAFQKIPKAKLNKILANKNILEALLANHIVAHPVCPAGVISEHHVKTLGSQKLTLDCNSRGPTVQSRRLRQDFLHGRNGLVYMLDDVLLPDKAKTVLELVEDERLYAFLHLIRKAGLEETFSNFEPYTLFAPSEAAMYSLPERQLEELGKNPERAKQFVLNHAILGSYTTDAMNDNQVVMSLDEITPLRLQIYRGSIGIEDALIEKADKEGSNGVLHVIGKVLHPTTESLDEVLKMNGNFSIWLEAMDKMREVHPATFEEFKRSESSYTYFVPSNEAFRKLGETKLNRLMVDNSYLSKTLKNHVAEDMMASEGFKSDLQYAVKTKQNTVDVVRRNDRMQVNDATLTKCDMLNKNGIAHAINRVLLPDQHYHNVKRKRGARKIRTSVKSFTQ